MTSIADLARERINILGVTRYETHSMVAIEYQYDPGSTPRTWHKIVVPVYNDNDIYDTVLDYVLEAKQELEGNKRG